MSTFRFIIRGAGFRLDDGADGFFATRSARAPTLEEAEREVLTRLDLDWRRRSPDPPRLTVMASWRVGFLGWRSTEAGHIFFEESDVEARAAAWRLEVEVARPPLGMRRRLAQQLQPGP